MRWARRWALRRGLDEEFPAEPDPVDAQESETQNADAETERPKRRGLRGLFGTAHARKNQSLDSVEELDDGSDSVVYVFPDPDEEAQLNEEAAEEESPEEELPAEEFADSQQTLEEPYDPEPKKPNAFAAFLTKLSHHASHTQQHYTADEAAQHFYAGSKASRSRTAVCLLLFLLTSFLTLLQCAGWSISPVLQNPAAMSWVLLVFLLLSAGAALEPLKRGFTELCAGRFHPETLLLLTVLVGIVECVVSAISGRLCFAAVICAELFFSMWGSQQYKKGMYRTVRTLQKVEGMQGLVIEPDVYNKRVGLFSTEGSEEQFMAHLEEDTPVDRAMQFYVPGMMLLTLGLAILAAIRGHVNFIWAWTAMLVAATPLGGFFCYARPVYLLARRLAKKNAALCSWYGARSLRRGGVILLKDTDLFPHGSVKLNGVKTFGAYSSGQVLGFASAVLEEAECGLADLFLEHLAAEGGRRMTAEELRWYSEGGVGASVGQDFVLLGTYGFMKKMGVYMLENAKVKSSLYIAVNGELAGLAALRYGAAVSVKKALRMVDKYGGQSLVMATCNPMLTPAMVRNKFEIRGRKLVFPVMRERASLAQLVAGVDGKQCGIMEDAQFDTMANLVAGGRMLRRCTWLSLFVSLLSGILGIGVMCALSLTADTVTLTALNLLLFSLIWVVPVLLLVSWAENY